MRELTPLQQYSDKECTKPIDTPDYMLDVRIAISEDELKWYEMLISILLHPNTAMVALMIVLITYFILGA